MLEFLYMSWQYQGCQTHTQYDKFGPWDSHEWLGNHWSGGYTEGLHKAEKHWPYSSLNSLLAWMSTSRCLIMLQREWVYVKRQGQDIYIMSQGLDNPAAASPTRGMDSEQDSTAEVMRWLTGKTQARHLLLTLKPAFFLMPKHSSKVVCCWSPSTLLLVLTPPACLHCTTAKCSWGGVTWFAGTSGNLQMVIKIISNL